MVTHRVMGYQPDLLDPNHDVIDGGVGGERERDILVSSVRIYDVRGYSPERDDQEARAFWAYYELMGDYHSEEHSCQDDTQGAPASETSFPRAAKAARLSKSKAALAAKERT